ncbi:MAG TPA: sensor histidine kinase [Actinomycetota bacterium]|nr:sensor histidine kinase [Actinomycetota bacterium]
MDRRSALRPPWFDVALVALLIFIAVVTRRASSFDGGAVPDEPDVLSMVLAVAMVLPLLWRRAFPIQALAVAHVVYFARLFLGYSPDGASNTTVLFAIYSVGAYAPRPTGLVAGVVAGVLVAAGLAISAALDQFTLGTVAVMSVSWIAVAVIGDTVYTRRRYQEALEERARALELERDQRARLAVQEERARISRELHDVWAHTLTTVVVQAGAAEEVLDSSPEAARTALGRIQHAGRQALAEVRRLIASDPNAPSERRPPAPGLSSLPDLAEELGRSGVPVQLSLATSLDDLPPDVGLSAYRIVQQALTNTLTHGGPGVTARVDVRREDRSLLIDVVDDGLGASVAPDPSRRGRGLIGMRERVALFGGELEAGPRPEGGFAVHARIPLEVPA